MVMIKRSWVSLSASLLLGAATATACGVKDLPFTYAEGEGPGQGKSGSGGQGNSGSDGQGGSNGQGVSGANEGGERSPALPCHENEKRCSGNVPETCDDAGIWHSGEACGGDKPLCTGGGVCAAFLLLNAGITELGVRPAEQPTVILYEQRLSSHATSCVSDVCMAGGIR